MEWVHANPRPPSIYRWLPIRLTGATVSRPVLHIFARRSTNPPNITGPICGVWRIYVRRAVPHCRASKGNIPSHLSRALLCVAYGSVSFACVYKSRALAFYTSPPHVHIASQWSLIFFLLDTANTKKGKCLIFLCQQRWDKTCNFLFMFFLGKGYKWILYTIHTMHMGAVAAYIRLGGDVAEYCTAGTEQFEWF